MNEHDPIGQAERAALVADRLRVDAAAAEALRALEAAGVEAVLLKGAALTGWIYPPAEPRSYLDADIWIRPGEAKAAEAVLSGLGFARMVDERGLPEWWQEHGSTWSRPTDGVVVDLHRTLAGLGVTAEEAWAVLSAGTGTTAVAGQPVRILAPAARAMHITLHAAHHGQGWGKALEHLERALSTLDDSVWREAAALAGRVGAADAFATGLRLVPEGVPVAERLGMRATRSVKVSLRASTPPPIALGLEQLAEAEGIRARIAILARKVVPPPGFVRHWWPPAARSLPLLVVGYLYRPVWLLRNGPRGARAWLDARRRVRRS